MIKPWSDKLRNVDPYIPGEQSKNKNIIKLNANENPYPPSPAVLEALRNIAPKSLSMYPDSSAEPLVSALAEYYGVERNQIFAGNGSDDVLALSFMSFFNSDKPILFPDITYSFYPVWCRLFNIPYETPEISDNFRIDPSDYYKPNGGVIIPNPNAPTGISEGREFIRDILEHNRDSIVIIDEAYVDFGGSSSVELINEYDNLLIVQTFSKSRSLAGMRIGAAIGNSELISVLNSVKNCYNSYTMDSAAIACGTASVKDDRYFRDILNRIISTRERSSEEFKKLGFTVYPSHSNFIFVTKPDINARDLFEALKRDNIFIRYFNLPRIDNHLRITIGTDEQMDILIEHVKNYLNA
ncbi:histidinol-phosphate transaminase [Lachnospiraceae bacterium NSJ-143]|nr:histidinol-phosphate transaminase [Lachnospiraceae bacterium NSJ-143]